MRTSIDRADVTALLEQFEGGSEAALERLMSLLYAELHEMAHRQLRGERAGHTLNTTALVHESYLKLVQLDRIRWKNRAQFYALAAQAMRRVLVNYALQRRALKRGGGLQQVPLDEETAMSEAQAEHVLALDEAMEQLRARSERQCRVVEYRFFGGLTVEETAAVLDVSPATVKRDWDIARAFLNRALQDAPPSLPE